MSYKYDYLFGPYGPNFKGTREEFNRRCESKEKELGRTLTKAEVTILTQHSSEEQHIMREFPTGATSDRHGHPRFYEILKDMADLHSRKNHDYSGDDPLSNLRASEEIGIPAWKGILIRLMDKWGRLKTFARTGNFEVKDESVKDTLMDNAVYSILCIIMLEEKEKRKQMPAPAGIPQEAWDNAKTGDSIPMYGSKSIEPPPEVTRKIYEAEGFAPTQYGGDE